MILWPVTFGFGVLSALSGPLGFIVPIFNMEAVILVTFRQHGYHDAFWLALIGSLGQNVGKLSWYYAARGSLNVGWLKRQLEKPRTAEAYARWQGRVHGRHGFSAFLTFASAAVGFPPFFAIAAVAGTLRINVVVFFLAGWAGRTLFFWAILAGADQILHGRVAHMLNALILPLQETSAGATPYWIGGGILAILFFLIAAMVAFGGGREHS